MWMVRRRVRASVRGSRELDSLLETARDQLVATQMNTDEIRRLYSAISVLVDEAGVGGAGRLERVEAEGTSA
jgi:hypothetical protein